jgi:O-antigen ligase
VYVSERLRKPALIVGVLLFWFVLGLADSRPGYFANEKNLESLLLLELLLASVLMYRRFFFTILILSFLFAGIDLPLGGGWTMARWAALGIGAFIGILVAIRHKVRNFNLFHLTAFFAVLAALTSAAVSPFANLSLLKVLSLFLLFLYAATGARLAVAGRENQFFSGLLLACEIFVGVVGLLYFGGKEVMGNPNSLGAVMGVVAAPILLWGMLLQQSRFSYWRRVLLYAVSVYLTFFSHARAGILAALLSSVVLCVALRRYGLLARGLGLLVALVAIIAISEPQVFQRETSAFTSDVIFKGQSRELGVLSSRESPWKDAMDSIQRHFWFGTGFGTSDTGQDATAEVGRFSSNSNVTTEHGSSYLAITSWVGMAGLLPFALLVGLLLRKIAQSVIWMYRTANPAYGFVPLAMVTLAGLVHAGFEDWLFAPGYYLCVFFWSAAFIFIDETSVINSLPLRLPAQSDTQGSSRRYQVPVYRS